MTAARFASLVDVTVGGTFAALEALSCFAVTINNNRPGAVDLAVQRGASGGIDCVPANSWATFDGLTQASQLQLRRWDAVATNVTVSTEVRL